MPVWTFKKVAIDYISTAVTIIVIFVKINLEIPVIYHLV